MSKSVAVLDSETCPRCRMLHGEGIRPPHGACTNPNGCRCASSAPAEGEAIDLDAADVRELELLFGDAVDASLL